jgi:eukaryotic-like serine/threonine-protein kinase
MASGAGSSLTNEALTSYYHTEEAALSPRAMDPVRGSESLLPHGIAQFDSHRSEKREGVMATSVESNPPPKGSPSPAKPTSGSGPSSGAPAPAATANPPAAKPAAGAAPVASAPAKPAPGTPPTTKSGTPSAGKSESGPKDPRGLSALDELNLERSILRRGLATPNEIEACKAHRAKLAAAKKDEPAKGLLEVMVAANVLTKSQAMRLIREIGETQKKFEIPGYQMIERIGKGSMGVVYKAKQNSVDRIVAVKVLLEALAKNKEFIKRFDREAKIAAKLSHNNIVNAIDAGEVSGNYYFVMEYIEGETVKDLIEKGKIFEEKTAVEIILAVGEALQHANQRGLIHRDVKPENILLTKDRMVKLADLGLARLTSDEKWAMSEAGMAIGTPYYISPEQVRGQVDVDIRTDIYSLGATFYHMVTGRPPYDGDTPNEVMKKHVDKNVNITPPDHLNTRLSSGLGEVVETMMAKNREDRYRSPDDLILDLKCLLQGERPMIAERKANALDSLAEGEATDDGGGGSAVSEGEKAEMAAYVNSRTNIIAALALILGLSVVTNLLLLLVR